MSTVIRISELKWTGAKLVPTALAGDRDAWEKLFQLYNPSLYCIARSFGLDQPTSDDAVQTTWLRLVEHIGTIREPSAIGAWLMTTLRRYIISLLRSRARGPHLVRFDGKDVPDSRRSPEEEVTMRERDARLHAALRRLPVRDRRLLVLLMASSSPNYSDVSAELDIPIGSIGPTRARSLSRLRHELEAAGIDDEPLSA